MLSTNAAGGDFLFTTTALVSDGGFINLDTAPILHSNADYVIPAGSGAIGAMADSDGSSILTDAFTRSNSGTVQAIDFATTNSWGDRVQLIAPRLPEAQHPEGGQIAIIDHPEAGGSPLAGPQGEQTQAKLARQGPESPAVEKGVGSREATQVDGLRGRAVVFEVANANAEVGGKAGSFANLGGRQFAHQASAAFAAAHAGNTEAPVVAAYAQRTAGPSESRQGPAAANVRGGAYSEADGFATFHDVLEPGATGNFSAFQPLGCARSTSSPACSATIATA